MFKTCLTAVLGTVCLGVAAIAAADPSPPAAANAAASVKLPPDESVSPAERARAAAAAAATGPDMSRIEEIQHADGSTEWVFNGQSEETITLVRDAQGKPHVRCNGLDAGHAHQAAATEVSNDER